MPIEVFFYLLQSALQVFAIVIVVQQLRGPINIAAKGFWSWFAAGFTFQLIRRILALIWFYNLPIPDIKAATLVVVPTCVSVCYAIAMYKVAKYVRSELKIKQELENRFADLKKVSEKIAHSSPL